MVKTPPNLSQAFWSKNKAKTLRSTGFGKALGELEAALELKNSLANFRKTAAAIKNAETIRKKAEGMCVAAIHKETLEMLEVYKLLLSKASAALKTRTAEYEKGVAAWLKIRADGLAAMKKLQAEMAALKAEVKKAVDVANAAVSRGTDSQRQLSKKVCLRNLDLLKKMETDALTVMTTNYPTESPANPYDVQDRDPADFTASKKINEELAAARKTATRELEAAMMALDRSLL